MVLAKRSRNVIKPRKCVQTTFFDIGGYFEILVCQISIFEMKGVAV